MKNIYLKTFLILCIVVFVSCDSDLLLQPESVITIDGFFKTEDDARSARSGMYDQMRGVSNVLYLYGDERADNTTNTDLGAGNDANMNNLKPETAGSDWEEFYDLLKDVNLVIAKVPDIEFNNESEKNEILGEAYFIRAWTYFMMVRIWGDVPIIIVPIESPGQPELIPEQRDPANEVFAQIKSDIETSLGYFPNDNINTRYRASKPAANMLKAEVFLWTAKLQGGGSGDLNTALTAINQVVGHGSLQLLDDYYDVFRTTESTNEDILSMYRDLVEPSSGNFFANRYNVADTDWMALSDEDKAIIPQLQSSVRFYTTTQVFRDQIIQNANGATDPREKLYFLEYTASGGDTRWVMNKYAGEVVSGDLREFTDDAKLYRYADAILMKAEIENALGNTDNAVALLNQIRNRVGIGNYAGQVNQTTVDDAILMELGIELAFEAKRFFDLVRFGKAYDLIPTLIASQPILWPISTETMSLNPNLAQTPGY